MKAYSAQVSKTAIHHLHYDNTNHMLTTIKIVEDKENQTIQWKEEIRTAVEETKK